MKADFKKPTTQRPQYIDVTIAPDGTAKIETNGFTGAACQAASLPYEEVLGAKTSDVPTAESKLKPSQVAATVKGTIKTKIG